MNLFRKDPAIIVALTLGCVSLLAAAAAWAAGEQVQGQADEWPLPFSRTIERQLSGGDIHLYAVELKRGESLRLDLTEKGVDCVLTVIFKHELEVDFGEGFGRETVTYIAEDRGKHLVLVTARVGRAGAYSLNGTINPAEKDERQRARALHALMEGHGFWHLAGGVQSAGAMIQKLAASLKLWQELKEDYWAAYAATLLGKLYFGEGRSQKAVEHLELALGLFRKTGDREGEALANYNMGVFYASFNRSADALKFYSDALKISEENRDEAAIASTLISTGIVYASIGSMQTAMDYYEKALRILKRVKNVYGESRAYVNMGVLYARTGETVKASVSLKQALALAKQTNNVNAEAEVLNEIADFYSQIGELRQALGYGLQALDLYRKSDIKLGQANVHNNIGEIYAMLGERREAITHLQKAATIFRESGVNDMAADALSTLSRIYGEVGNVAAMSQTLREAREFLRGMESENPHLHAYILLEEGHSFRKSGDSKAAHTAYAEAIKISRATGYPSYEGAALFGLAELYLEAGDHQTGMITYTQALFAARSYNDPAMEAWALIGLMMSWATLGNQPLAIFYGKEAVNKYQGLRTQIRGLEGATQKTYLRKYERAYVALAYFLINQKRHAEALQVINAFRDQQFYDFNPNTNAPARHVNFTPREAAFSSTHWQMFGRDVALNRQIEELKRRAGAHPAPEQAQELDRLENRLEVSAGEFFAALRQAAADFSRPTSGGEAVAPLEDLVEMQVLLRELSAATAQKTVAIYTLVAGDGLAVLLVTPDSITAPPIVVDADFNEKVLQYYALLQSPSLDPRPLGKELYDIIVKPVESELRAAGASTLLWSLGGTLRYVPMASLWDGEQYLIERYRHVVFTRADRERMTRAVSRDWTGIGFGNSRAQAVDLPGDGQRLPFGGLPGVLEELRAIFRTGEQGTGVMRGQVLTDERFTKEAFFDASKRRHQLVHIASHFSFRPGNDTQSFLLLGDGTALTLNEMLRQGKLFEGVELLTLSACDTAATRADAMGREIDDFAESAQRLGAGAVLATLWTVADDSTPQLMREFYRARQSRRLTKAAALREAQLTLLNGGIVAPRGRASVLPRVKIELVDTTKSNNKRSFNSRGRAAEIVYVEKAKTPAFDNDRHKPFAHPYYWAPFILIGNGN